ncbi:MAG: hypothetical protein Q4G11_07535, partial [Gallicola sp.]|nr:hypothetical protein [Gallicola sp.]
EQQALDIFGGREVYFGVYAGSDRGDAKWEANFVGFVDMRKFKVGYNYKSRPINEDGTWSDTNVVNKEVPNDLMVPVIGQALNGKATVNLAPVAPGFSEIIMPTGTLTNTPYTPLKNPTLKTAGQNYTNDPSFTAVDLTNKKADIYLVPFKDGATNAERQVVSNYILEVAPVDVKVKIDYVTVKNGVETVQDSVIKTVRLGDETGVGAVADEKKTYAGYTLAGASDDATFDSTKTVFAKNMWILQLHRNMF